MEQQDPNTTGPAAKADNHSHFRHMWMMAVCCGVPIMGFIAIGASGINAPSLETLIALICPIGMVGMMIMMSRDKQKEGKGDSCCEQEETQAKSLDNIATIRNISDLAAGYGMPGVTADGNDVEIVHDAAKEAISRARNGEGPSLIELKTYRVRPFAEGAADPRDPSGQPQSPDTIQFHPGESRVALPGEDRSHYPADRAIGINCSQCRTPTNTDPL